MAYWRTYTIDCLEPMLDGGMVVGIRVRGSYGPLYVNVYARDWGDDLESFEDLVLVAVTWTLRLLNQQASGRLPAPVPELATVG